MIRELEQNYVRAFLHVNGIASSFPLLDNVPDSYRTPLVHRYIARKEAVGQRFETALGTLTILNNP